MTNSASDRNSERKAICIIFEEAITEAIGHPSYMIMCFHLKKEFGQDLYKVLAKDPRTFYKGLQRVLGAGADVVLSFINIYLAKRYRVNFPMEDFVAIFTDGDESSKLRLFEDISKTVYRDLH